MFNYTEKIAGGNGAGSTSEKLNSPWGINVDNNTGIYIVDQANHRVQYWMSGMCVRRLFLLN